jgi:hypothetical protein
MAGFEMEMENRFEQQIESSADLTERRNRLINDLSDAITEGTSAARIINIRNQINETDDKLFAATIIEKKAKIEEQIKIKNESLAQITELYVEKADKRRKLNKTLDLAKLREKKLIDTQLQIEYRQNTLQTARESLADLHKTIKMQKDAKISEVTNEYK